MSNKGIYEKIIEIETPIPINKFIEICLYNKGGYYTNSNVLGKNGDFTTSPEISQLFGEILGLYILSYWNENLKKEFDLIELGPGTGALLLDILRITEKFKNFKKSIHVNLIEKNINLIEKQKNNFRKFNLNIDKINWSTGLEKNYKNPIIIVANEFFDCFPIKQFYKKNQIWYEKMVRYDIKNKILKLIDCEVNNINTLKTIHSYNPLNILEVSKSREKYFSLICKKILNLGGLMITIDYGYFEKPKNFTLQSLYNNKHSNVLDNIGNQDITSLVDFNSLILIAKSFNLKIDVFTTQRNFLIKNGIVERKNKILQNCKTYQKKIIEEGFKRIIDKDNMGSIFKVLIVSK